ncbi:MAG TPA: hypothetical protein VKS43_04255 [Burkholderiales bacterium]|nr:hypothetical protein [Burkholderiales bacterium]
MAMQNAGLLLFTLALVSCGEMAWQKADGDQSTLAQDRAACERGTRDRSGGSAAILPPTGIDPRLGPTGPSQADVVMKESQMTGACMRAKGYVLVPASK